MTIQDIIDEIFESQEMQKYLCEHAEELYKFQIKEMIAGSPIVTLQRKLEIFEWLAESEDLEKELSEAGDESERKHILWSSYAEIAKNTKEALKALYDTTKTAIFLLKCIICWTDDSDDAREVFGFPDDMKLKSSMTLFALVSEDTIFESVLKKFFGGERDKRTIEILKHL